MRRYHQWAGNPKGVAGDVTRCIVEVCDASGWSSHQCSRKRGAGEMCPQHAKMNRRSLLIPKDGGGYE